MSNGRIRVSHEVRLLSTRALDKCVFLCLLLSLLGISFSRFLKEPQNQFAMDHVEEISSPPPHEQGPVETTRSEKRDPELPSKDAQQGVHDVEAVTLSWSRTTLIAVFVNIWFIYLVEGFQSSMLLNLVAYATSDFDNHSLLNVVFLIASAMSSAVYIPLAKILDTWGRAEGFAIMSGLATLGLVLMAISHNLPTFCAAYVFFVLGFCGVTFSVDVITADTTTLKNRGLAYAFIASPYMVTAFAGPRAAEGFYHDISWRWAFGCFAIVLPVVAAPLFFILKFNLRKARVRGNVVKVPSQRNIGETIRHYIVEFDALGVVLFSIGLVVFLLPFDIANNAPQGWRTGYIIAMLVAGFATLVSFFLWETLLAPKPMLNIGLIKNRTIIGACLLDATYQISYFCWSNYFPSFLQVVNNLSISEAGYVSGTFLVVSCLLMLVVGFLVRRTGRFKWLLFFVVPLYMFGLGLMIYFRRPDQPVGFLVMCQVFAAFGEGVLTLLEQLSVLAAVDHLHVAAALALLNVIGSTGAAMGATTSGAIWTNVLPGALARFLPPADLPKLNVIYEQLQVQLSYPIGSATRIAIQEAYGYTQTRMLAVGTGVMGLASIWILLIRNIDLTKVPQVKGTVF
ncbi:siderophore iron transporter mirB [Apiospora arundinis]|uniref:Siderophore iron transporter mirB n=1 Tax=Apiospora arundinis TaxID=335852 RepID=A0ABR2IQT6_9PEZI